MGDGLFTTLASLVAVCLLAIGALKLLGKRPRGEETVKLRGRLQLEPKRSVYVLEAGGRCFLVGAGDGGMALLAELDAKSLPAQALVMAAPSALRAAFRRVISGGA
jgi:flagellar biogenesis protein FliO